MPRCQRTLRLLEGTTGATSWVCPFCTDGERYALVTDADLLGYQAFAYAAAVRDFGCPADARLPLRLIAGLAPECVRTPPPRGYDLYLSHDADPLQHRLQIGHEMFHRVCSQGQIFHWAHEMMACVFSVRLLRASGYDNYATQMDTLYYLQAEQLSLEGMLTADVTVPPYPPGLYGRAYATGIALTNRIGWEALCRHVAPDKQGQAIPPHSALKSFVRQIT